MILLPVHNLGDNNVSYQSHTVGVTAVVAWAHRNWALYSQCVQNQIQFNTPHASLLFEKTQSDNETQTGVTLLVFIFPASMMIVSLFFRSCSTVRLTMLGEMTRELPRCGIDYPVLRQSLGAFLSEQLRLALGLNCRHSPVNSYSIGKPSEIEVSLPSTCC